MVKKSAVHSLIRPFLKWAGGKTQLLPLLHERLPEAFGAYHEPFVGAGALFFSLRATGRLGRAHISDANPHLIQVYQALKYDVEAVIEALLPHDYDKDHFYEVRATDPTTLKDPQRAARFIFLNRTCFNGLYRENKSGQFNVPFGRYTNPTICNKELLRSAAAALRDVSLHCEPFETVVERARPGDLVYFDPPYVPLSGTSSFTAYRRGGFGETDHRRLARVFRTLADAGVHVILSNSDAPIVHELYADEHIDRVLASRNINSKAGKRGRIHEVIVTPRPRKPRDEQAEEQAPLL